MKTLIFNGSPRKNGETAYMIHTLQENLGGEYKVVDAYRAQIRPCIYKNTADDMSALWTRHRRYRSILWIFLCGSGISVSSVRIRLHCKHGSIQPDAILSRTLKGFHGRRRKFLIQS